MTHEEIQTPKNAYVSIPKGSQVVIVRDENEGFASQATDEKEIDLLNYWHIFKKHLWIIVGLTLLIGILAMLLAFSLQPIYRSTALLLIEERVAKVISIEDVYGISSSIDKYYQTQLRILKSRDLAEKVVDQLDLVSHPVFNQKTQQRRFSFNWRTLLPSAWLPYPPENQPSTAELKRDGIINAVMGEISIAPVRNSQLVEISFESPDAKLAADIPNTLISIYIESDLEAKLEMTKKAASWLTERIEGLRRNLDKSEQQLQKYMDKENLINIAGIKTIASQQIEQTASYLVSAHQKFSKAQSVYEQLKKVRNTQSIESIPAILNHSLIQNLKQAELEVEKRVSEQSERYGKKHPKILAAKAELRAAKENTKKQIQRVIEGIEKEYELAKTEMETLEQSLKANQRKIRELNNKEYQLRVLEREVEANRQLYDLFLTRSKETNISQDMQKLQSTVGRIVETALAAYTPYKPKKKQIVLIGLALGFLFSTLLAFLLEHIDNTLKDSEDVEQKLGLPLLGTVPKIKVHKKIQIQQPHWVFLNSPKTQFAESIRTIRTGIMLSGIDARQKVLVVTSSLPSEGKTTLALNQAIALGQMEKTLLIEADMRRPNLAKLFGLNPKAPGLSELVARTLTFKECIHHPSQGEKEGIDVIPSGTVPPNPLELLSSQRFKEILDQLLAQDYKYIVIDSPPTIAVSDALVLTKYATEVLYVVKANATPYQVVREGLKRLSKVKEASSVKSIILNQLPTKQSKYYSKYSYYKNYYRSDKYSGYTQS